MKKSILIAVLAVALSINASAQIKFGIKAGITSTSVKTNEVYTISNQTEFDELVVKGKNAKIGFQGGIFSRITIAKIYLQPELLFTSTSAEIEATAFLGGTPQDQDIREQKFRQIDFPILLGYKFGPARIQAGPVGTIILSSDPSLDGFMDMNYKEEFNGATWGYQVGVGLDLGEKIAIDLKYEGSLSNLGEIVQIDGASQNFDSRNNKFILTLGIFF